MNCQDLLDRDFSEPGDQDHLRTCRECQQWRSALDELRAPRVPESLRASVLAGLDRPRPAPWWSLLSRGLAGATLVCYLMLLLTLGWLILVPQAPATLGPRLAEFWASAPDGPGPLDGGL